MYMKKTVLLLFVCWTAIRISAQSVSIIPQPSSLSLLKTMERFPLGPGTALVLQGGNLENTAAYLNDYLETFYGFRLPINPAAKGPNVIRLNYERMDHPVPGAYRLSVNGSGVYIAGDNAAGVFYGIQSLLQLLPPQKKIKPGASYSLPYLLIEDKPRFAYRGMHLDVGRHFFPLSFIKKYIDYLAYHKLNVFHWHLTEDQGWRMEIKEYPELTRMGAWRNGTIIGRYPGKGSDNTAHGGFYTQAEVKEVVQYAADRFVEVIPEIEMPGHSSAAIAAYPWLSCFPDKPTSIPAEMISARTAAEQKRGGIKYVQETWGVFDDVFCAGKETTFTFLEKVIDEVTALFPSKYFHIGGDECPKTHWKQCAACQERMKTLGLKDEHELQSYFVQRIEKYLNSKGKSLIGWDEILEGGLAPNAIVMSWRGESGGIEAARQKHQVIMTPGNPVYFDHSQSENEDSVTIGGYNPIDKVYAWDPLPKELSAEAHSYILGAQANVWTEYMDNPSKVEYMIFPRMAALSELLWTEKGKKDWKAFERKLPTQLRRYESWKANFSRACYDIKAKVIPASSGNGVAWSLESRLPGAAILTRTGETGKFTPYKGPVKVNGNGKRYARLAGNQGNLLEQAFILHKAVGRKISLTHPPSKSYPGDGALTLVNAVQNRKGTAKSSEFLGFSGTDCEALIDLGKEERISSMQVHCLQQTGSWIWEPASAELLVSSDGKVFTRAGITEIFEKEKNGNGNGQMQLNFSPVTTRYLKVVVKNHGTIKTGNPGAGNKSWLFLDEIVVN